VDAVARVGEGVAKAVIHREVDEASVLCVGEDEDVGESVLVRRLALLDADERVLVDNEGREVEAVIERVLVARQTME